MTPPTMHDETGSFALQGRRVWVAGHRGLLGSALVRRLAREDCEIITVDKQALDLRDADATDDWVARTKPDAIFVAAGRVGGIGAQMRSPVEFLDDNARIDANIMRAAWRSGVTRLMQTGSAAMYPEFARQPFAEDALMTGRLDPSHYSYATAKLGSLALAQAYSSQYGCRFLTTIPTNLYGREDNFDPASSHVLIALIRRFHEGKQSGAESVEIWGTGTPRREFLHIDDMADACIFLMASHIGSDPVNIGWGSDISIREVAEKIASIVGFEGRIRYDASKPDGVAQRLLDTGRLKQLGWQPSITLEDGLTDTYRWYLDTVEAVQALG